MELKFKALFKHISTGKTVWLHSTVNHKVDDRGLVRMTEWLQYVGKEDKNGNEIFVGDVFRFKYMDKILNYPIELLGSFSFGSDLSFEIDVYKNDLIVVLHYVENGWFSDFEIIGNIKETPDLIEKMVEGK